MSEQKYTFTGRLIKIGEVQSFASGFTKREFVVTDGHDKYPQDVKFELVKDKTKLVENVPLNSEIEVSFNVRGNEYNGKHYVNLQAWRVQVHQQGDGKVEQAKGDESWDDFDKKHDAEDEADDVPF